MDGAWVTRGHGMAWHGAARRGAGRAALRGASSVIVDAQTRGTHSKTRAVFVAFCAITGLGVDGAALQVDKAVGAERYRWARGGAVDGLQPKRKRGVTALIFY